MTSVFIILYLGNKVDFLKCVFIKRIDSAGSGVVLLSLIPHAHDSVGKNTARVSCSHTSC